MKRLINKYRKWNPSIFATILLLIIPFLMFLIVDFKLDNDFWFLINTGRTIINEGFITIEPFTIHSGLAFIPQQWLTDVVFYYIYNNFGVNGMYYLIVICNSLFIWLCYKLCYLVSGSKKKSILITIITDVYLVAFRILTTRPQFFDAIIFILELFLLESYIKKNKKIYLYFIPLLSLLLINLHASFWVMLFVFMIPYFVEYFYSKIKKRATFNITPVFIIFIISILVGFINPYGIESIKYLFNSYGVDKINATIIEMNPMTINTPYGFCSYIIIFLFLVSFYYNKGNNKTRYFLLGIGTIFLSLMHWKGILYLSIIYPLIFGNNLKSKIKESNVKVLLYEKIIYVILICLSMFFIVKSVNVSKNDTIKEFADYLDEHASYDIKLYTDYNKGGYMEYRGYKCYIDPRAEVFLKNNNKKEDIFEEYYDILFGRLDTKEFLDKYDFDYLLVDDLSIFLLKELQNNPNYEEVFSKEMDSNDGDILYLYKKIDKNK